MTDDRPYFSHFFRWRSLDRLRQRGGNSWFPVEEWGYLLLLATILQALTLGLVLILLPLVRLPHQGKERWICLYFLLLGGAFMFVEIVFIQRLVLFLSHPTYAVAVALAGFLLFAGLGSALSSRIERIRWVLLGIVGLGALYTLGLTPLFYRLMGLPDVLKILVSLLILAPLAACMGMPFPLGMRRVTSHTPAMVPWAWGINGCASVVGAVSAVLASMSFGFTAVTLTALGLYLVAGWTFERL